MAGVKITDLTPLGTSASDDLFYIVDVSDFTESPQGTSKQIEVGNMFSSGTYTPTISGETNGIVVTPNSATFIKVGSIVSVSAQIEIVLDAAETTGSFEMSLPVASNFTNQKECFGILQWSYGGTLAEILGLSIASEVTNNTCEIQIETANVGASLQYCTLQIQYQVI
jgi:hypothetical protein